MPRFSWRLLVPVVAAAAVAVPFVVVNHASGSATPPYLSYAVKFACGDFGKLIPASAANVPEGPVKPGDYQTAINVHNPSAGLTVAFVKKAVLLYSGTKPVPETAFEVPKPPRPQVNASLQPDFGMLIDCQDIRTKLVTAPAAPVAPTFIEGYVVIQQPQPAAGAGPAPLDVTAMYTSHGYNCTVPAGAAACTTTSLTRAGFVQQVVTVTPTLVKQ